MNHNIYNKHIKQGWNTENNYESFVILDKKNEYEECINLVETWYTENLET